MKVYDRGRYNLAGAENRPGRAPGPSACRGDDLRLEVPPLPRQLSALLERVGPPLGEGPCLAAGSLMGLTQNQK